MCPFRQQLSFKVFPQYWHPCLCSRALLFHDIVPVLVAALLSALIWDFFFIPPRFTLTVGTTEDKLLLLMYFIVAMINAVLTNKIRKMEKEVKAGDEKERSVKFYGTLFNSLSHELRTPITAIIGCIDNLQANSPRLSEKNKEDLLSEISVSTGEMYGLEAANVEVEKIPIQVGPTAKVKIKRE